MQINQYIFILMPLISLLCNLFLFVSCVGAKRDKRLNAFILMLIPAMIWALGALFLRLDAVPELVDFWNRISITSIFIMPLMIYNFIYHFIGKKNTTLHMFWWIALVGNGLINLLGIYITDPQVITENGTSSLSYTISPWIVICLVLLFGIITYTIVIISRCISQGAIPASQFFPIITGNTVMIVGVLVHLIPEWQSIPTDSFACAINAMLLYTALYKQRVLRLKSNHSDRISSIVAALLTAIIAIVSFPGISKLVDALIINTSSLHYILESVLYATWVMGVYKILRKLSGNLFIKSVEASHNALNNLAKETTRLLSMKEILNLYKAFLKSNFDHRRMHICLYNQESDDFRAVCSTEDYFDARAYVFRNDYPILKWLRANQSSLIIHDFKRTTKYKAMWDNEKQHLKLRNTLYVVPIAYEKELIGFVLCEEIKSGQKSYSISEIEMMESAAALVSIAIKSNMVSAQMRIDAQRDSLTGLYNRQIFMEKAQQDFDLSKFSSYALLLLNVDDFRQYNELYGSKEADAVLKKLGALLCTLTADKGLAGRISGKEFMISLPFYNTQHASEWVEQVKDSLNQALAGAKGKERPLTFSAGVCGYPSDADNFEELCTNVNLAVGAAKRNGKNQIKIYERSENEKLEDEKQI